MLPLFVLAMAAAAHAWMEPPDDHFPGYRPRLGFVTDGTTIMNAAEMHLHVTNWGLIGSAPGLGATFSDAPSCQWPAGSGNEFLYIGGLWIGGRLLGQRVVSMGRINSELLPRDEVEATLYEAVGQQIVRPLGNSGVRGNRRPMADPDDDHDGLIDEETLDGHDNDGDGLIDEDFGQIGTQMMVATMYDNTRLASERYPDHTPMNLEVVQRVYQWDSDNADDFTGFDFTVTNIGVVEVEDVFIGFFADGDVGNRNVEGYFNDDMAGSWTGTVRGSDGKWVPVELGFMWDDAEYGRLDSYFGIVFLNHDVDPTGRTAPAKVGLRTFQKFRGVTPFDQGGDPTNDDEAYQLLSAEPEDWDGDSRPGRADDYRFLVSTGPFEHLAPDASLSFQMAFVCGNGLGGTDGQPGLLANCAEAWLTWHGTWIDEFTVAEANEIEFNPGILGRETMLCREDFDGAGENLFDDFALDYMDTSCLDPLWVLGSEHPGDNTIFIHDGKHCAMFNMDNCYECMRRAGRECRTADFGPGGVWNCNDPTERERTGCTGIGGNELQITWLVGMAPPPPGLRLWPTEGRVHVYWDDEPEHALDVRLQTIDFESYRLWRADNWSRPFGSTLANGPESSLWQLVAEYDVVNQFIQEREVDGVVVGDTLALGRNTGLEGIVYRPRVLDDPAYEGLAAAMQEVVDADVGNELREIVSLRDPTGAVLPEFLGLVRWEAEPDVLDTFFAVAERPEDPEAGVIGKRAVGFYEFIDRDVHDGFLYFYAVAATDHLLTADRLGRLQPDPRGLGLEGDPGSSFAHGVPGSAAQTAAERAREGTNIYVYPNPATRDALAEYQQFSPSGDDPTGVRVTFANLPAARNTVSVYTVAGDLVSEMDHDGTAGVGHLSWNLMSRNNQEVVSGVYLYVVQSQDSAFEDFVGKFVVVR